MFADVQPSSLAAPRSIEVSTSEMPDVGSYAITVPFARDRRALRQIARNDTVIALFQVECGRGFQ